MHYQKQTKMLAAVLSILLVFLGVPRTASAAENSQIQLQSDFSSQLLSEELNQNSSDQSSVLLDVTLGSIKISQTGYSIGGGQSIPFTGSYVLTGSYCNTVTPNSSTPAVLVDAGSGTIDITLQNMNIQHAATNNSTIYGSINPFRVTSGTVRLTLEGENSLIGSGNMAGLYFSQTATVEIYGNGSLSATGGHRAPGIGANYSGNAGTLIVHSGVVNGIGGNDGAGIGASSSSKMNRLEILGGEVSGGGGNNATGIGKGRSGQCISELLIAGGIVQVSGMPVRGVDSKFVDIAADQLTITGGNIVPDTLTGTRDNFDQKALNAEGQPLSQTKLIIPGSANKMVSVSINGGTPWQARALYGDKLYVYLPQGQNELTCSFPGSPIYSKTITVTGNLNQDQYTFSADYTACTCPRDAQTRLDLKCNPAQILFSGSDTEQTASLSCTYLPENSCEADHHLLYGNPFYTVAQEDSDYASISNGILTVSPKAVGHTIHITASCGYGDDQLIKTFEVPINSVPCTCDGDLKSRIKMQQTTFSFPRFGASEITVPLPLFEAKSSCNAVHTLTYSLSSDSDCYSLTEDQLRIRQGAVGSSVSLTASLQANQTVTQSFSLLTELSNDSIEKNDCVVLDLKNGEVEIEANGFRQNGGELISSAGKPFYIINSSDTKSTNGLAITGGQHIIVLDQVQIQAEEAFRLESGSITLLLSGENLLESTGVGSAGLYVSPESNLCIDVLSGSRLPDSLTSLDSNGLAPSLKSAFGGTLLAASLDNSASGIGGEAGFGNIDILGGFVEGCGYSGIGCGKQGGNPGNIAIHNGAVYAKATGAGSGISSGSKTSAGNVTISGGVVFAEGATGIGNCAGDITLGSICISGGSVTALGHSGGGIGAVPGTLGGSINISGPLTKVNASSDQIFPADKYIMGIGNELFGTTELDIFLDNISYGNILSNGIKMDAGKQYIIGSQKLLKLWDDEKLPDTDMGNEKVAVCFARCLDFEDDDMAGAKALCQQGKYYAALEQWYDVYLDYISQHYDPVNPNNSPGIPYNNFNEFGRLEDLTGDEIYICHGSIKYLAGAPGNLNWYGYLGNNVLASGFHAHQNMMWWVKRLAKGIINLNQPNSNGEVILTEEQLNTEIFYARRMSDIWRDFCSNDWRINEKLCTDVAFRNHVLEINGLTADNEPGEWGIDTYRKQVLIVSNTFKNWLCEIGQIPTYLGKENMKKAVSARSMAEQLYFVNTSLGPEVTKFQAGGAPNQKQDAGQVLLYADKLMHYTTIARDDLISQGLNLFNASIQKDGSDTEVHYGYSASYYTKGLEILSLFKNSSYDWVSNMRNNVLLRYRYLYHLHTPSGNNLVEGEENRSFTSLKKSDYLDADTPANYSSIAFPWTGLYFMQEKQAFTDSQSLFLVFSSHRRGEGHELNGYNKIQLEAFGKPMLVNILDMNHNTGYAPDNDAPQNSYNMNTVHLYDENNGTIYQQNFGSSDERHGPYDNACDYPWYSSDHFDYVQATRYPSYTNGDTSISDTSHRRRVIYLKDAGMFLVVDTMSGSEHTYLQTWNFGNGFTPTADTATQTITATNGNTGLSMYQLAPGGMKYNYDESYQKYNACDLHSYWSGGDTALTLLVPYQNQNPVSRVERDEEAGTLTVALNNGKTVRCSADMAEILDHNGSGRRLKLWDNSGTEYQITEGVSSPAGLVQTPSDFYWVTTSEGIHPEYGLQNLSGTPEDDNTSVQSVSVCDFNAQVSGDGAFYAVLDDLPTDSSQIIVQLPQNSKAKVSVPPYTNDGGYTWLFTVTAENGSAKTYTVTIRLSQPNSYLLTADPDISHGSVLFSALSPVCAGQDVSLTVTPDAGYQVRSLKAFKSGDESIEVPITDSKLTMPNFDVVVTVQFEPIAYSISYDLAGGILPDGETNPETYTVESDSITLVNPTRSGRSFAGWTGTGLTEAVQTLIIPAGSIGNRSYTASWTLNNITGNTLTIHNSDNQEIGVTVAQVEYLFNGAVKQMKSVSTQRKTISAQGYETFEIDPQKSIIVYYSDTLEPIEIP